MARYASLIGALGAVMALFGFACFLMNVFGGGAVDEALGTVWISGNILAGLVLVGVWLALGFEGLRERMSSGEGRRVGKYGTSAIATTALSIAIVVGLAFLAERNSVLWDWSEAGVHSLADQSLKVLDALERDVRVTAFFSKLNEPAIRRLLDKYAYESDRFDYEVVDPDARPDLVERLGIDRERLREGLLHVALGESQSMQIDEPTEENLTNALVKLQRTTERTVVFLGGHGERPIEGEQATERFGLSLAAAALENEGYRVETALLMTLGAVPENADAVVVAGPRRALRPEEQQALERYLEAGGSVLVMLDPGVEPELLDSVAVWGVDVGRDLVIDRVQGLFGQPTSPVAAQYAAHPITGDLNEITLFHQASSVRPRRGAESRLTQLVLTSENAWGERDLELFFAEGRAAPGADDLAGPVPLGVAGQAVRNGDGAAEALGEAAEDAPAGGRIVVFGDSDFASNELLDAYRNRDLFLNSVNWLLGDVEAISVRPKQSRASRFTPTNEQLTTIRTLSLFVLPEAIAILGVFAWWSRRRAPGR